MKSRLRGHGGTQRTYQRMIQQMDLQIGRVLQALDANSVSENTIIILPAKSALERLFCVIAQSSGARSREHSLSASRQADTASSAAPSPLPDGQAP
jgi:hypothetical protein